MPVICFASPKGGVGKTMLAGNLAQGLQRLGRRVIAIDLDPQNALRLHFGMPLADRAGLFAAPDDAPADWRAAARRTASGVVLLPHGSGDAASAIAGDRIAGPLAAVLRDVLADPGTVLVVDTPAGPSGGLTAVLPYADLVILPLLADGGSIATLPDIETGRFLGGGTAGSLLTARLRFILNQVEPQARLSASVARALMQRFGPALLGVVGRDEAVAEALACGQPVAAQAPRSRAAQDLAGILAALDAALGQIPAPAPTTPPTTGQIMGQAMPPAIPTGPAWAAPPPPDPAPGLGGPAPTAPEQDQPAAPTRAAL